jgi:hypothetical protein
LVGVVEVAPLALAAELVVLFSALPGVLGATCPAPRVESTLPMTEDSPPVNDAPEAPLPPPPPLGCGGAAVFALPALGLVLALGLGGAEEDGVEMSTVPAAGLAGRRQAVVCGPL